MAESAALSTGPTPMYHRLDCDLNLDSGDISPVENVTQTLLKGRPVDPATLVLPWPFTLKLAAERKLSLSDYYSGTNLMSQRLVDVLLACGVDNLQIFPAAISRADDAETIPDYCVVNVLGLVAAADPGKSKSRPLANVKFFEKLAVDPARARGLLMFRLAESLTDIIVADSVAQAIKAGDFTDVTLEPVS
jgi:hypothetical protein